MTDMPRIITGLETDGVPAPSDFELTRPPSPRFKPFMAVTFEGQLVEICGQTARGNYIDRDGFVYRPDDLTRDLRDYAERHAEDARDQADTQADALR